MEPNIIPNSLMTGGQSPLDKKLWVKTLAELQDLGPNFNKAFIYYEGLKVYCLENNKTYVWGYSGNQYNQGIEGLINGGFTYPDNSPEVYNIEYANKNYNFYEDIAYDRRSDAWDYFATPDSEPTHIPIVNCRNFIVLKDLEHDVTITHTLNPENALLQQWYGWTHRVGRAIGGNKVTIKHNSAVDVLNSREVAYFLPNEEDYELKEGEILTFSTISKGIYLGEMLEKRVYVLISSNMGSSTSSDSIIVEGNPFTFKKNPNNTGVSFEVEDMAIDGWDKTNNKYISKMSYNGGDPTLFSGWNIIDEVEF